ADGRLGRYRFPRDEYLSPDALPLADPPADPDAGGLQRRGGLDVRDRGVRLSFARRIAPRDRRLEARNPAGAGPLSRAILGSVRRLRAGHAAVWVIRNPPRAWRPA